MNNIFLESVIGANLVILWDNGIVQNDASHAYNVKYVVAQLRVIGNAGEDTTANKSMQKPKELWNTTDQQFHYTKWLKQLACGS